MQNVDKNSTLFRRGLNIKLPLLRSCKTKCSLITLHRSSYPEVFLVKGVLKICGKFTGEQPCRNVTSIKLQSKSIKLQIKLQFTLRHECSPVSLLHIFRMHLSKNTSKWLLLTAQKMKFSITYLFSKCEQIHSFLLTFTEEILNENP